VRLCRYEADWRGHWGLVEGDTVFALEGSPYESPQRGAVVGSLAALAGQAERPLREGGPRLLAPCAPRTIWSNGANYPSRCHERGFALPQAPSFLWAPATMLCGTGAEIRIPEAERRSEYGAELGVVLGRDCRDVSEAEAEEAILGYTALNNIWIKDADQVAYERPLRVYDNHCPTGPLLITRDELGWRDHPVRLWVDGELRQDDRTSSMLFSPAALISFLSRMVTVRRGDLLMTGTPGGVEGQWLKPGQTVEVEIGPLGRLRNHVTRVDGAALTFVISVKKWVEQGGEDLERATVERAKARKGPSDARPGWSAPDGAGPGAGTARAGGAAAGAGAQR
jgi:2-keto-4-pentenoate hydratase/2-oxohepta-3-ene-1,7-dioic acid hydratase in catechol pathway